MIFTTFNYLDKRGRDKEAKPAASHEAGFPMVARPRRAGGGGLRGSCRLDWYHRIIRGGGRLQPGAVTIAEAQTMVMVLMRGVRVCVEKKQTKKRRRTPDFLPRLSTAARSGLHPGWRTAGGVFPRRLLW